MKHAISTIIALAPILTTCGQGRDQSLAISNLQNVFEDDQRQEVEPDAYPFSAMGRLATHDGKWCTAFLVAPNIAMSNAHCMTTTINNLTFYLGYNRREWKDDAKIIASYKGTTVANNRVNDWAVVVLDRDVGESQNWFEIDESASFSAVDPTSENTVRTSDTDGPYSMAGYPKDYEGGHALVAETGCEVTGRNAAWNYLYHDCDNRVGASGSPIYYLDPKGRARVVAINAAERFADNETRTLPEDGAPYSHSIANLATAVDQFLPTLKSTLSAYPAGDNRESSPLIEMIEICNQTNTTVYSSFAFRELSIDTTATVSGWYSVKGQECLRFPVHAIPPVYGFAFHWSNARPKASEGWPEVRDREHCVQTDVAFNIDSSRPCLRNVANHMFQPFGKISTDNTADTKLLWTISPR